MVMNFRVPEKARISRAAPQEGLRSTDNGEGESLFVNAYRTTAGED
jgi:hypothetical protein